MRFLAGGLQGGSPGNVWPSLGGSDAGMHASSQTELTHEDVNVKNNNWCCNGAALSHAAHELTGIQQVQGTELPGPLCQVRAHSGDLPIAPESLGAGPGRKNLYVRASFEVI